MNDLAFDFQITLILNFNGNIRKEHFTDIVLFRMPLWS